MNSKMFFQLNNNNTVSSKIEEGFEKNPKKVYIFSGNFKEGGFNILEDNFIDSDAKKYRNPKLDKYSKRRMDIANYSIYKIISYKYSLYLLFLNYKSIKLKYSNTNRMFS